MAGGRRQRTTRCNLLCSGLRHCRTSYACDKGICSGRLAPELHRRPSCCRQVHYLPRLLPGLLGLLSDSNPEIRQGATKLLQASRGSWPRRACSLPAAVVAGLGAFACLRTCSLL